MDEEHIEDAVIITPPDGYMSHHGRWPGDYPTLSKPASRDTLAESPLYVDALALLLPSALAEPAAGIDELIKEVRNKLGEHLGVLPPEIFVEHVEGDRWSLLLHQDEIASGTVGDDSLTEVLASVSAALEANAGELLTYDATVSLITWARLESPALVNSMVPNIYDISMIRRTFKTLLREGIPIRPISVVLGAMSDVGRQAGSPELAEAIRPALWRLVRRRIAQPDGSIKVVRLAPGAVHGICSGASGHSSERTLRVPEDLAREVQRSLDEARTANPDLSPFVVACPSRARRWISAFIARKNPDVVVVGDEELANMPDYTEACVIGEGIVPVPQVPGDGRQVVEAYVEGGYFNDDWGGNSNYLVN